MITGGSLKLASTADEERFNECEIGLVGIIWNELLSLIYSPAYVAREMLSGISYLHDQCIGILIFFL
jgi:hypothetical protein